MSTNHNWTPGDVALKVMTDLGSRSAHRTLLVTDCTGEHVRGPHWHHVTGGWDRLGPNSSRNLTSEYVPLVVLNPADDEEMADLARSYVAAAEKLGHPFSNAVHERIVARLREALSPTPPPLPPCRFRATINGALGSCYVVGQHDTHLINNVSVSVGTA